MLTQPDDDEQNGAHDYTEANRTLWNTWTTRDIASEHHRDVARYRATGSSLRGVELAELGAAVGVAGKSLLHLQCNMGSETLSWVRLGAHVTGVDIADDAIARAQTLATEGGLTDEQARFIRADIYDLPPTLDGQFDIVFTSYGALFWLPDLTGWARLIARCLKPSGVFYMVEMSPLTNMLSFRPDAQPANGRADLIFQVANPYAHTAAPQVEENTTAGGTETVYVWSYGLGETLTALIQAGLRLEYVHEFPFAHYQRFPMLVQGDDSYWRWPAAADGATTNTAPLLFSTLARKDG